MASFFGGDHRVAHYTASPIPVIGPARFDPAVKARVKADRDKLKAAGWVPSYQQFMVGNEKAKAKAKARAEAEAAQWSAATGVKMQVTEGCFL